MDHERFAEICERYRNRARERAGIGTLGEKTLHAVLKDYFQDSFHQIIWKVYLIAFLLQTRKN